MSGSEIRICPSRVSLHSTRATCCCYAPKPKGRPRFRATGPSSPCGAFSAPPRLRSVDREPPELVDVRGAAIPQEDWGLPVRGLDVVGVEAVAGIDSKARVSSES